MPKDVLRSNWYYEDAFGDQNQRAVKPCLDMEANGYDQVFTRSYHRDNEHSIMNTGRFCSEDIPDQRLFGFMQSI